MHKRTVVLLSRCWRRVVLWGVLAVLPFLDGGTSFLAKALILILPLPLVLLNLRALSANLGRLANWKVFLLFVFAYFVFLSLPNSTSLLFSLPAFFQLMGIILLFILFYLLESKESLKILAKVILTVGFGLSLLSFYYFLPMVGKPSDTSLVYATYGHNHLADYLLLVIPFSFAFWLKETNRRRKFLLSLLNFFYLISFLLTFSRGAFLVLPLVLLGLIYLTSKEVVKIKKLSLVFLVLPLLTLGFIYLISTNPAWQGAKLANPATWFNRQVVKLDFDSQRVEFWRQALLGFQTEPLSGFGWGTFEIVAIRFQRLSGSWANFAHNFYLQVLAEGGIISFLSFLGFLGVALRGIWLRAKKENNAYYWGGLGAVLASSLHSFVDYDWHFPAVFLTVLVLVASLGIRGGEVRLGKWREIGVLGILGGLGVLGFVFGQILLAGEYFYQKGDYQRSLPLSVWSPVRARQVGDKIFEQDFNLGEKFGLQLLSLSGGDPSMNYWLADKYFYRGDKKRAISYYGKAIEKNPLGNYHLYSRLGKLYEEMGALDKQDRLYEFFAFNLEKESKVARQNNQLAKILYSIGKNYLEGSQKEKALFWWGKAAGYASQWSYFHLELASLQNSLGNQKKARETLANCLAFQYPAVHCKDVLQEFDKTRIIDQPGYWQKKIEEIPE